MNYVLVVALLFIVIILLYFLITYNQLVKLANNIKEAFATMDVYLKKRWDLIPGIIEVVKGYSKHEKDTLKEIVTLRNGGYDNLSQEQKLKTNEKLTKEIDQINILVEKYPDIKADQNYLELQHNLKQIEDEIAQSRKYYNAVIRKYNNKVEMIPSNIVAKITGHKVKEMFEAKKEERDNIQVDLS